MKNVGKILGLVGAAVAILWAMRDRLVSIAAPQDVEPPRFRVVTPSSAGGPAGNDDLTEINGIGPVFASRLRDAGISSFSDITTAGPARIAEVTGASESRVEDWLGQAAARS